MRCDEIFLNKLFIIEAAHKAQHFYYSFGFCIKKKNILYIWFAYAHSADGTHTHTALHVNTEHTQARYSK